MTSLTPAPHDERACGDCQSMIAHGGHRIIDLLGHAGYTAYIASHEAPPWSKVREAWAQAAAAISGAWAPLDSFEDWMETQGYPSPDDRYDSDEMALAFEAGANTAASFVLPARPGPVALARAWRDLANDRDDRDGKDEGDYAEIQTLRECARQLEFEIAAGPAPRPAPDPFAETIAAVNASPVMSQPAPEMTAALTNLLTRWQRDVQPQPDDTAEHRAERGQLDDCAHDLAVILLDQYPPKRDARAETLSQVAYEAWWANRPPVIGTAIAVPANWDDERPAVRAQWEAAVVAVAARVKPRWTDRFGPVVACDHDQSAEVVKHRTRLAMLLADTPFEFRPGWADEYDDAAPKDNLVPPTAEQQPLMSLDEVIAAVGPDSAIGGLLRHVAGADECALNLKPHPGTQHDDKHSTENH